MKRLLIVVGAFAMMYWAYKAGERAAIRSCVDDLDAPGEKKDEDAAEPATPEQGAEEPGVDNDDVSNFIGMNANL